MKLFRISTVPISLNILLKGQLKFLNRHFAVTAVSGAGKDLDDVAGREGVPVHPIEIERQISPLKDLVSLYRLYRYFKKEKPEIVHSITPKAGFLSMVAARLAGVPVRMHTFTGLIFPSKEGHLRTLLIWMDRLICKAATHVYPEGRGVREDLISYGITGKPLKIIANGNVNGTDTTYFSPDQISPAERHQLRENLGLSENDFVYVFVGRLVTDKGVNELVTAFKNLAISVRAAKGGGVERSGLSCRAESGISFAEAGSNSGTQTLKPSNPQIKLLLVGPKEDELDALHPQTVLEMENNPNIISVGFQQDVRPYFAVSHALILPSYREGFPNAVLQAGAMELPAIVSDINGCNEIITHGENGLIVPAKDSAALEQAMHRLLSDRLLYTSLKQNARPHIGNNYRQEEVWQALLEEYRTNLAATGRDLGSA